MPVEFQLKQRLAGFAAAAANEGQQVRVISRELVSPNDALHLLDRLDQMQSILFGSIPGLPPPSLIDHMLVVIRRDLSATAYVNELHNVRAEIQVNRGIIAGEPVYAKDIANISSVDLGVEIGEDCAVVLVRSFGWRRSLFFDFGPLHASKGRNYQLSEVLAQQALMLIGMPSGRGLIEGAPATLERMTEGLVRLRCLLGETNTDEARYQELIEEHPWMLGGTYSEVRRHPRLDDRWIPDFIVTRCHDQCHDLVELKQPFLALFRGKGSLNSSFNDAWNQAEGYLNFALRERDYLRSEKQIFIENPRCILLAGHGLTEVQRRRIRDKEALSVSVAVITYDELLKTAEHMHTLVAGAGNRRFK
ncbi:MAG: DUF4263 domain-containing protein [Actinobacteria bacterium]|nr:DUF4263 domain-containing protein [Actinomycetota bacterium]